jgi:hypothetical protein
MRRRAQLRRYAPGMSLRSTRQVNCPHCSKTCYIQALLEVSYRTRGVEQEWSDGYTSFAPVPTMIGGCPGCEEPFWFDDATSPNTVPVQVPGVMVVPPERLWAMLREYTGGSAGKALFRKTHLAREILWLENSGFRRTLAGRQELCTSEFRPVRRSEALMVLRVACELRGARSETEDLNYAEILRELEEWDFARSVLSRVFTRPSTQSYAVQLRVLVDCKLAVPVRLQHA